MQTKKERVLPPQVRAAKLAHDTEALSAMGRAGNRIKQERARQHAVTEEYERNAALVRIEAILSDDWKSITLRDAIAHHMANLAGVSQD